MKKILLIAVLTTFLVSGGSDKVYICNSKNATRYHKTQTCRGLNACKHERTTITLQQARDRGLTLCKWEQ